MFGTKVKIFSLFGFDVSIDLSWLILAVLVTWSLAKGLFPNFWPGYSQGTYWIMGICGTIGLVFAIVFHEFCHSLLARRFGMPMKGITLFIFGGVAEMQDEPPSAKAEFYMSIAGPLASILLSGIFYGLYRLGTYAAWAGPVIAVMAYLAWINIILAIFNLVPAFPLDGGRILRSALWAYKKNIKWATRIASNAGATFGIILMILGFLNIFYANFVGGIWWLLIGLFIKGASNMSYQRLLMQEGLKGEPVEKFMKESPVTVPAETNLADLVEQYLYKYHYKMLPVMKNGSLIGCIHSKKIKDIPREQWPDKTVEDVAESCGDDNAISPGTDSVEALSLMNKSGNSRLIITQNGQLKGIVTLKDMLKFLSMKLDFEGQQADQIEKLEQSIARQ
jgi:Zn-dependent protease/predicted transcriptional regulator